jgi:hypothetical protein
MTNAVNIAQSGSNNQTMRNRIINGAMTIDQRGVVATTHTSYVPDRFRIIKDTVAGTFTMQQSSVAPAGFRNSALFTVGTAYTPSAGENNFYRQGIEGFNVADLNWGTANAQPVTLSFWVRSSLTGTLGGSLRNGDSNRSYPFSYTISAANTWEYKTVSIPGDTTGTWLTTNGIGVDVSWGLSVGSNASGTAGAWAASNFISATGATNITSTAGATWYITGVQLEEGTAASPFENRLYGTELNLCQRYYYKSPFVAPGEIYTVYQTNAGIVGTTNFPAPMRTTPTMTYGYSTPYSGNTFYEIASGAITTWTLTDARVSPNRTLYVYDVTKSGLTLGNGYSTYLTASAEL